MQTLTTIRTLAFASMLALSIASPLAVHAQPNNGGGAGGVDRLPDGSKCELVTAGFYDCTGPNGGEWYCTSDTDPDSCVNVTPPNTSQEGTRPIIIQPIAHPVLGGVFEPGTSNPAPTGTHLPVRSISSTAP